MMLKKVFGESAIDRFFRVAVILLTLQIVVLMTAFAIKPAVFTLVVATLAVMHGIMWIGAKKMLTLFFLVTVISWGYETCSILTGFPFGHYDYSDILGQKIGLVPINIMPMYFGMGYFSWVIAHILLGKTNASYPGISSLTTALAASFIMVIWDVTIDPFMSTIQGNWVWENGGAYYGVPLVNFAGWFLCVFTFYFLFALLNRSTEEKISNPQFRSAKKFWLPIPICYGALWIGNLYEYLVVQNEQVVALNGQAWWTQDIWGGLLLVASFTILPIALLAVHQILTNNKLA